MSWGLLRRRNPQHTACRHLNLDGRIPVLSLSSSLCRWPSKALVNPYQALALPLGANRGTAINPVLEGQSGTDLSVKRLPIVNLMTRVVGVTVGPVLLEPSPALRDDQRR